MRALIQEIGSYAVGSAAALGLDIAVLTLLVNGAGWPYLPAAAISFIAGSIFLYWLSVRFIFSRRRITNEALELPSFVALGAVGLLVNMVGVYLCVEGLHLSLLAAKLGAAGCSFGTNFLLRRYFLFSRSATE